MIKSISIINYLNNRVTMELTRPELSNFLIDSVDGLGPAKANINTTEMATSDGALYNSARLSARNIVLKLIFITEGVNSEGKILSIEDVRQKSYKYFPIKRNLTFIVETDNRTLVTTGYVESNEPEIFGDQEGCAISIICTDPYFYSLDSEATLFYGVDPNFEFPFSNESPTDDLIEFGIIENKQENVVTYYGDADVGVTIVINAVGSVTNLKIYNSGTREVMSIDSTKLTILTGHGIIYGDQITICTVKGKKSVYLLRDGVNINILNALGKENDWFTLARGDNIFAFTADVGATNLQFRVYNQIIYEGV